VVAYCIRGLYVLRIISRDITSMSRR